MGWASAILSGVSTVNQISKDADATKAAVAQAADNQRLAEDAAADATARGGQLAGRARMQGSQLVGAQKVGYANSGVDSTVGTPADVAGQTRMMSELDAKTMENNAAREAWGFRRHGLQYGQQAALEAAKGSARQTATFLTGAGRIASGLGSEYSRGGWADSSSGGGSGGSSSDGGSGLNIVDNW